MNINNNQINDCVTIQKKPQNLKKNTKYYYREKENEIN